MAFQERNLVDTQRPERFQRVPINAFRNPAVEDAQQRIIGDILLGLHIGDGATYQLENEMAFVGLGVEGVRVIPVERLRDGGMVVCQCPSDR